MPETTSQERLLAPGDSLQVGPSITITPTSRAGGATVIQVDFVHDTGAIPPKVSVLTPREEIE